MNKYGFLEEQVRYHLRRLARKRLIETPYAHYREIEVPDREAPEQFHFRATSIGLYHLLYWSGSFRRFKSEVQQGSIDGMAE